MTSLTQLYRVNGVLCCGYVYSIPTVLSYVGEWNVRLLKTCVMQHWYVMHVVCNMKHHLPGTTAM